MSIEMQIEDYLLSKEGFMEDPLQKIENLLAYELFGANSLQKIHDRYSAIATGNCFLEDFIPICSPSKFSCLLNSDEVLGLDFPVWFGAKSSRRRIMIACQDSGRKAGFHVGRKEVVVTAPFGVHNAKWRNGPHGKPFETMIFKLLEAGCSVYVTDSIKFFASKYDAKTGKQSDNSQLDKSLRKLYLDILKKEIDIIKPYALIAMGGTAWKIIENVDLDVKIKDTVEHLSYRYGVKKGTSRGELIAKKILEKIN